MDRVRDLVATGGVSVVLAQDRDRIAREPAYRYLLKREFEEYGTKICRSPLAQGALENVLRREGLGDEVFVNSAGTGSWHIGSPPDERAQRSAGLRGHDISGQRARRVTLEDCQNFDYVLTMDEENYQAVAALCREGSAEVRPFLDFALARPEAEVPDPFYGGPEGFEHVLDLVEEASEGLLEEIKKKHLMYRI